MQHLRFSKYDIKYRDENGYYLRDDWTSISHIGDIKEGELLTREEYERVEKNYLNTLHDIAQTVGVTHFHINGIELNGFDTDQLDFPLINGTSINLNQCLTLSQKILRNEIWCKIESEKLNIYFGYEYYIYISFEGDLDTVKAIIKKYDLFWEIQERGYFDGRDD